jgi:hypothetical protein
MTIGFFVIHRSGAHKGVLLKHEYLEEIERRDSRIMQRIDDFMSKAAKDEN